MRPDMRAPVTIDREKHCPFLLRVFCNEGGHNRREDYENMDKQPISNELHIYTWPDATLREIADLIQDAKPDAQKPMVRMAFSTVTQDRTGRIVIRKAGWVNANRRRTPDEDKTLDSLHFQAGDFLDVLESDPLLSFVRVEVVRWLGSMVRVSSDEFLAKVATLYGPGDVKSPARKATVAISCKSVPADRVKAGAHDDSVLLFRVARYGNNRHKSKFSTVGKQHPRGGKQQAS
ncbi:hypothetical protein ATCC90586_005670 [Pythium insidiosum]|nr:hypothetical protein ATCC90586_005670 [Pythium insidiosum]